MKIFLSHSSQDKQLVDDLRRALELRGSQGWLDAREMRGGDMLSKELKRAGSLGARCARPQPPSHPVTRWLPGL